MGTNTNDIWQELNEEMLQEVNAGFSLISDTKTKISEINNNKFNILEKALKPVGKIPGANTAISYAMISTVPTAINASKKLKGSG